MINLLLIIAEAIVAYLLLTIMYKKHKTEGIYYFAILATFMACILNLKQISIMNVNVPIGFGITTALIIGMNVLIQQLGKEEVKKYILIIAFTWLVSYLFLITAATIKDSEYNLLSNESFNNIFNDSIRSYLALIISLVASIYLDSKLYYMIKKIKNKIIYSNVFSIIIVEFLENITFVVIAYLFEFKSLDIFLCIILRYMIKTMIGLIGTIPLYIINRNK